MLLLYISLKATRRLIRSLPGPFSLALSITHAQRAVAVLEVGTLR